MNEDYFITSYYDTSTNKWAEVSYYNTAELEQEVLRKEIKELKKRNAELQTMIMEVKATDEIRKNEFKEIITILKELIEKNKKNEQS